MTPTEAVRLTGYIQAHFPSQPINEFTPDALSELLVDYPMADCQKAVLNLAGRNQWCAPSDVATEVRRIRARRIDEHEPLVPPPSIDASDVAGQQKWLREARRRVADGETVEMVPAIEAPKRDVAAIMPKLGKVPHTPRRKGETGSEHHERMAEVRAELKARVAVPLPVVVDEDEEVSA